MFFLIPWRVDVPQDRRPVMNWLIIIVTAAVFVLQMYDYGEYLEQPHAQPRLAAPAGSRQVAPGGQPGEYRPKTLVQAPGITRDLALHRHNLKGLFGYMWLHADLLHLLGNILFLWIFGNAVCAKVGNLRYLAFYVLLGVAAGAAQLLCSPLPQLGASGAINGIVGMYAVLFYENEITCLFAFWFILPYVRWFSVSSIWIILLWLSWDVVGALVGGSDVGHIAHLSGFAAGFGITLLLCKTGWITMERYERSLWQRWEQRKEKQEQKEHALDAEIARLGLRAADIETPSVAAVPEHKPIPLPSLEPEPTERNPRTDAFVRTACACGRSIKVTRQYVGRAVRCPHCGRSVVIPPQTDSFGAPLPPTTTRHAPAAPHDGFIRLVCPCGRKLKVPAHYAGRCGKCPQCGARLRIPPPLA